ncbi:MAG: dihydroneopterin aldolase [Magnetococcus sp. DMHC-6]
MQDALIAKQNDQRHPLSLDQIHIRDLLLRCIIGIYDLERQSRQDVLIQMTIFADLRQAGKTDAIEDTINYKTLTKNIIQLVENSSFNLIETLATEVARVALEHERVLGIRVTVEKPGALRFSRSVGVTIERGTTHVT